MGRPCKVYKWGFFRVARVLIDPAARDYLEYTLLIEKINYAPRPPTPRPPKPYGFRHKGTTRTTGPTRP